MPLTVHHGPLPADGDRVTADTFLEEWVSGCRFSGFAIDAFDVDFGLISSQTDAPPATPRGQLWFKRGEGRLYFRDDADRGDTRYTAAHWCSIAPVREVILQVCTLATDPIWNVYRGPGAWVSSQDTDSGSSLNGYYTAVHNRQTQLCSLHVGRDRIVGGHQYILSSTAVSGRDAVGVEWGYTRAMVGSGYSAYPGAFLTLPLLAESALSYSGIWFSSSVQAWTGATHSPCVGVYTETSYSTEPHLVKVFKRPNMLYDWKL